MRTNINCIYAVYKLHEFGGYLQKTTPHNEQMVTDSGDQYVCYYCGSLRVLISNGNSAHVLLAISYATAHMNDIYIYTVI